MRNRILSATNRRDFLKLGAALPGLYTLASAAPLGLEPPADREDPILVVIRLGGGNDGLNTLIPFRDDHYHRARPSLRIEPERVLKLDDYLGLHPSLSGMKQLFDEGALTVLNSVGYPAPNRSHFRSMDIWHTAEPESERRRSGWIGRALDQMDGDVPGGYSLAHDGLPLGMIGERTTPPVLSSIDDLVLSERDLGGIIGARRSNVDPRSPRGRLLQAARIGVETAVRIEQSGETSIRDDLPYSALGRDLQTILRLIDARLGARVFYVSHDGFDTHTRQADNHAALLSDLDRAIFSFQVSLRARGIAKRTVVMTFSEFGRRVAENGSRGTDHGAASPMFMVGDAIHPGVVGPPPDLVDLDDGDVRHQIDFRSVYATLLERWFGVDPASVLGHSVPLLDIV